MGGERGAGMWSVSRHAKSARRDGATDSTNEATDSTATTTRQHNSLGAILVKEVVKIVCGDSFQPDFLGQRLDQLPWH